MTTTTRSIRLATPMIAALASALLVAACYRGRDAEEPQAMPGDPNQPPGAMPPPGYAPPPGQAPPPGYAPTQPGPAPAAAPASPLALPCQNDLICGTHKCNMQTGRCSFPCAAPTDCASGFTCMGGGGPAAICVPAGTPGTAPPAQ